MSFRVLYDANAVFGALQRSMLVRVGTRQTRFNLRVLLTDMILDEMIAAVSGRYPDFTAADGDALKAAMLAAIPDCLVTGYGHALGAAEISDPGDRHVLAAAIHARAQLIITEDRAFDRTSLLPHGIEAQSPDDFLTDMSNLNAVAMNQLVAEEAAARNKTIGGLAALLEERGLIRFAQRLRG